MHPYQNLGESAFWATAVAKKNMFDIEGLWDPKFEITQRETVATFGSCFAQHIGRALDARGFNWLITEPAPAALDELNARKYNYGVFSARTGNIYTVSQLRQWVDWATGERPVPDEVWTKVGRCYDPFRPNIEPNGFVSRHEIDRSRELTIEAFKEALRKANIFVFTLGLTESWFNKQRGHEYPMCPGTVAGDFDEKQHEFVNQDFPFIRKSLVDSIKKIRSFNPNIRFLLTVSPVPLTATNSGRHVLVATMESKSILRAVAGQVAREFRFVDYFPSYEIITGTPYRGTFFEANQRNVNAAGVEHVMAIFFKCLNAKYQVEGETSRKPREKSRDEAVCEEELLSAFAR